MKLSRADKIIQTRIKNHETNIFKYVYNCPTDFFDQLKFIPKIGRGKSWFLQYSKFT